MTVRRPRYGFVLLTVIWAVAITAVLAAGATEAARNGYGSARNRIAAERAHWAAVSCASRLMSALDTLRPNKATRLAAHASASDLAVGLVDVGAGRTRGCRISLEAVGSRLDLNRATREQLRRLIGFFAPTDAAALADSLLQHRPIDDVRALQFIPGLEHLAGFAIPFGTDSGPVSLRFAPREVLLLLPGVTGAAADTIIRLRSVDSLPAQLVDLLGVLPQPASDILLSHFPEFSSSAVVDPVAWIARIEASDGRPAVTARIEMRLTFGRRTAVQWERMYW